MNQSVENESIRNGYDVPPVGLSTGHFDHLQISAIFFTSISSISALIVICMSYNDIRRRRTIFFRCRQIDRFVVYMAVCECLFSIEHASDHIQVFVTRDHTKPKALCQFYGFWLMEVIAAQFFMVNAVAVSMFLLIFFNKKLNFGRFDWKLLLWMLAYNALVNVIAFSTDTLGPNQTL